MNDEVKITIGAPAKDEFMETLKADIDVSTCIQVSEPYRRRYMYM